MISPIIAAFEKRTLQSPSKARPKFRPGDSVRIGYKIPEGSEPGKFRVQAYEGVVTRVRKGTAGATFTVRKIGAGGVGVERVFPLHSPLVDTIEVIAQGKVRRSRLYYLRDLSGKKARIKNRTLLGSPTGDENYRALQTSDNVLPEAPAQSEGASSEGSSAKTSS